MKVNCLSIGCFTFFLFSQISLLFSCGICIYFPVLIGVKNGRITSWKISEILLKNVDFDVFFQGEVPFYTSWFSYILIIWRKCLAFQFLSCGIPMSFPHLTGVKTWLFSRWKIVFIFLKIVNFESQFPRWRSVLC